MSPGKGCIGWIGPAVDPHRYEIYRLVGTGGEGRVFYGAKPGPAGSNKVFVALKEYALPEGTGANVWPFDSTWVNLEDQRDVLAGIRSNPHLVLLMDTFKGEITYSGDIPRSKEFSVPFAVMEWIDGLPASELIAVGGIPLTRRLEWVRQLSSAVLQLHTSNSQNDNPLVHSDIKPENCVIRTGSNELVLVDLGGLQRVYGQGSRRIRTTSYAPPEIISGLDLNRTIAADIYSLGATAFFMVTGKTPPLAEADYIRQARRSLNAAPLMRTALLKRRRKQLMEHVLLPFAEDPKIRAEIDIGQWSERLRLLDPTRKAKRRAAGSGSVLAIASAIALGSYGWIAASTPNSPAEDAFDSLNRTIAWNLLPQARHASGSPRYSVDFKEDLSAPWRKVNPTLATARRRDDGLEDDGLEYSIQQNSRRVVVAAPIGPAPGSEAITVRGTLESGQGGWGVWCRGTTAAGQKRYSFMVTHAGAVGIFDYSTNSSGVGNNWWYLKGVDWNSPINLRVLCEDTGEAKPIKLTLEINDRTVLVFEPDTTAILGPGFSGVECFAFGDLPGPRANIVLENFSSTTLR
ncbi:serine/threonine protein kinase [Nonomuraea glycinis]|uniref:serine/threonine protein kinase n=1 Tax=Nonomuraea glycinis TaxID=2047744 RepID=UPI002E12AE10|nr:hypothetical protein OHA68_06845 [Nonomuraea glycinis]